MAPSRLKDWLRPAGNGRHGPGSWKAATTERNARAAEARAQFHRVAERIEELIARYPVWALGLAASVGVMLGLWTRRR